MNNWVRKYNGSDFNSMTSITVNEISCADIYGFVVMLYHAIA